MSGKLILSKNNNIKLPNRGYIVAEKIGYLK